MLLSLPELIQRLRFEIHNPACEEMKPIFLRSLILI